MSGLQREACKTQTHGRLTRFPPVSTAAGMIYERPSQVPTAPDHGHRGRGREKQGTPARSLSSFLGQTLFTCRLQVVVAGPVNTTGRPVGLAQPGHLSRGFGATVMVSQPKLVSCLIPSGRRTTKPYRGDMAQSINKHMGSAARGALYLHVSLGEALARPHCHRMIITLHVCRVL